MYTIAFLKPPFAAEGLRGARYTIPSNSPYSNSIPQLIRRMLVEDPDERATINEIMLELDAVLHGGTSPLTSKPKPPPSKVHRSKHNTSKPKVQTPDLISWNEAPVAQPPPPSLDEFGFPIVTSPIGPETLRTPTPSQASWNPFAD